MSLKMLVFHIDVATPLVPVTPRRRNALPNWPARCPGDYCASSLTRRGGDRASPVDTAAVAHDRGDRQRRSHCIVPYIDLACWVSARLISSSGECYRRRKS